MDVIEDVRGVIQDLVVPDLKAIEQRVTDLEKSIDQRFAEVERAAAARHAELLSYLALDARVRKIEQDHVSLHTSERMESEKHAR